MSDVRDIPGFYYDHVKNRYFAGSRPHKRKIEDHLILPRNPRLQLLTLLVDREIETQSNACKERSIWETLYFKREQKRFADQHTSIKSHVFLRSANSIVSVSSLNKVYLWSFGNNSMLGEEPFTAELDHENIDDVYLGYSNDTSIDHLLYKTISNDVILCDITESNTSEVKSHLSLKLKNFITDICFNPKVSEQFYCASGDSLFCISSRDGSVLKKLGNKNFRPSDIICLGWNPQSTVILGGHRNGKISVFDPKVFKKSDVLTIDNNSIVNKIHSLEKSPGLIAVSAQGLLNLWDLRMTKRAVREYEGHSRSHVFCGSAVDYDDEYLYVSGSDGVLRTWSLSSETKLPIGEENLPRFSNVITSLFRGRQRTIVSSSYTENLILKATIPSFIF